MIEVFGFVGVSHCSITTLCHCPFVFAVPSYLFKQLDANKHQPQHVAVRLPVFKVAGYPRKAQGITAMPVTPGQQQTMNGYAPIQRPQAVNQVPIANQPSYSNAALSQPVKQVTTATHAVSAGAAQSPRPTNPVTNVAQPVFSNATSTQQPVEQVTSASQAGTANAAQVPQPTRPVTNVAQPVFSNLTSTQQPVEQVTSTVQAVNASATPSPGPTNPVTNVAQPVYSNATSIKQPVGQVAAAVSPVYSNATAAPPQTVYANATATLVQQPSTPGPTPPSNVTSIQQPAIPVPGAQQPGYINTTESPQPPQIQYGNVSAPGVRYPVTQPSQGVYSNATTLQPTYPQQPQPVYSNVTAPQGNETVALPPANETLTPPSVPQGPGAVPVQVGAGAEANATVPQTQPTPSHAPVMPEYNATAAPEMPLFNATVAPAEPSYNATLPPAIPAYNATVPPVMPTYNATVAPAMPSINATVAPAMPSMAPVPGNVTAPAQNVTAGQVPVLAANPTAAPQVTASQLPAPAQPSQPLQSQEGAGQGAVPLPSSGPHPFGK